MSSGKNLAIPSDSHRRTSLATAGWYNPASVAKRYEFYDGSFWLGRSLDGSDAALGYDDDRHICLIGGTRGGKGASCIINNLCLWPGSCVILDPKGENATVTARRRGQGSEYSEGMGQKVHVLDPFNIVNLPDEYKSSFNPLDALDPDSGEAVDEAARLADAMLITGQSKEPFWEESARELVKGIILHVITTPRYSTNLITVRSLITGGDWETYEIMEAAGEKEIPSAHKLLLEEMSRNPAFGGVIRGIGTTFLNSSIDSPRTYQSVLQTAVTQTEFLDSEGLRSTLVKSDFKLSDLKTDPNGVSIYLALPQRYMNTHFRWFRMMVTMTITEMEKVKGLPACGHRVLMVMDEFAGLKRMEIVENAVAQMAGFGVKLFYIAQTLPQLKSIYQDNWETLIANAGLKIFFDLEDHFSRDYVSKLIGETEIIRDLESSSRTHGRSENYSEGESHSHTKSKSTSQSMSSSQTVSRGSSSGGGQGGAHFSSSSGTSHTLSHSTSHTEGESDTYGTSRSRGHGTSESETRGMSQNLQKTLLITPDEIGRMFSRIDDNESTYYPGLALIMTTGQPPFPVRRCNYFEDVEFIGCFDPHPDHPEPPQLNKQLFIYSATHPRYQSYQLDDDIRIASNGSPANVVIRQWLVQEGDYVHFGQPIAEVGPLRDVNGNPSGMNTFVQIYAPGTGIITNIGIDEDQTIYTIIFMIVIDMNRRQTFRESRSYNHPSNADEYFNNIDYVGICWSSVINHADRLRMAEATEQARLRAQSAQEEADKKNRRQRIRKAVRLSVIALTGLVLIYFGYIYVSENKDEVIALLSLMALFGVASLIYNWIRKRL